MDRFEVGILDRWWVIIDRKRNMILRNEAGKRDTHEVVERWNSQLDTLQGLSDAIERLNPWEANDA